MASPAEELEEPEEPAELELELEELEDEDMMLILASTCYNVKDSL
jgi:hypothetical protein